MSDPRELESKAFKRWFSSQKTFNSLSAMERALDITNGYLHLISGGARRAADPELRRKLREATGLSIFDPIPNKEATFVAIDRSGKSIKQIPETSGPRLESERKTLVGESPRETKTRTISADSGNLIREIKELRKKIDQMDNRLAGAGLYQDNGTPSPAITAEERAKRIMRLLTSLSDELEYFKSCTETERNVFKNTIPGQDIGYITTLLRALYDEDKFQRWLLFSSYTMKGKDDGE